MKKLNGMVNTQSKMQYNLQYFADSTEEDIAKAFGVELPSGEKDVEAADQQPNEKDQDVKDDNVEDKQIDSSTKEPDNNEPDDKDFKDDPQNKAFAQLRREKEEAEKIKADLEAKIAELEGSKSSDQTEEDKRYEKLALEYGRTDIKTKAQYEEALRIQEAQDKIKAAGVEPDSIQALVDQHIKNDPRLSGLLNEVETLKNAAKQQEEKAIEVQLVSLVNDQITMLNSDFGLDVSKVSSTKDYEKSILQLENGEKVIEYVNKGLDLKDAYLLANKDTVIDKTAQKTRQQTLNKLNGHNHVKNVKSSADSASFVDVPDETYSMYKQMFPKMSDKQIREHYSASVR